MCYKMTTEDVELVFKTEDKILNDMLERTKKISVNGFYDDSESVTVPPSLLEQFNKLGMPRPISREELKEAMDYYNRICGNTNFSIPFAFEPGGDCNESV